MGEGVQNGVHALNFSRIKSAFKRLSAVFAARWG
jgi:hypothetical protein